jgi:hypothetical protein
MTASRAIAAAALVVSTTACVSPARTDGDYALKAANTAEAVASAVGTAVVAVRLSDEGRVPARYLRVVLREAEEDASSAQSQFDAIQPPSPAADDLRARLDALLDQGTSTLADLRIAARRSELSRLAAIAATLPRLAERLEAFEQRHGQGP